MPHLQHGAVLALGLRRHRLRTLPSATQCSGGGGLGRRGMSHGMTPATPTSLLHLFAAEPAGLSPCPQCDAWQWRFGLVQYQFGACGYRGSPPPQENVTPPNIGDK
jgi:hypothetical protein